MKTTLLVLIAALPLCGCAHFATTQTDQRGTNNVITTHATATTFFQAKSGLSNFKASQSEKTQSAHVGALSQDADAATGIAALTELLKQLNAIKSPVPVP